MVVLQIPVSTLAVNIVAWIEQKFAGSMFLFSSEQ